MSIDARQLREHVIRPACEAIGLYSLAAEELLLGTACQESKCGTYLKQLGAGPALGIFQMEPRTHEDIWHNFLHAREGMMQKVEDMQRSARLDATEMAWNLRYAAAMCRIHYYRVRDPLPGAGNLNAQAHYWKQHYNTPGGAGTLEEYVQNWRRYAL